MGCSMGKAIFSGFWKGKDRLTTRVSGSMGKLKDKGPSTLTIVAKLSMLFSRMAFLMDKFISNSNFQDVPSCIKASSSLRAKR